MGQKTVRNILFIISYCQLKPTDSVIDKKTTNNN